MNWEKTTITFEQDWAVLKVQFAAEVRKHLKFLKLDSLEVTENKNLLI